MDAVKLLEAQHREVEQLFKAFEQEEAKDSKYKIFTQIADALAAHATIEEKHLYPAAMTDQTEDMVREALEEHLSVKRLIADIMEVGSEDENFDAKVKVLQEQVEHHVEEEEEEMFAKLRKLKSKEELEQVGEQMEDTWAELMIEGDPRKDVPSETDHAPSMH